jgi:hypothetical protein
VTINEQLAKVVRQAAGSGIHQVLNKRLRELGRGGYGTVDRDLHIRILQSLIDSGEMDAAQILEAVDVAVVIGVRDYMERTNREIGWLMDNLGQINETIDSHRLHMFLKERGKRFLATHWEYLQSITDTDKEDPS